jgi:HD superfamily phosphohydrolase
MLLLKGLNQRGDELMRQLQIKEYQTMMMAALLHDIAQSFNLRR